MAANKTIGLFIKRKNVSYPVIAEIHQELLLYLFEMQIMITAIDLFMNYKLLFFDSLVGDQKCQTRTSIILDLLNEKSSFLQNIETIKHNLNSFTQKIQNHLIKFDFNNLKFTPENINFFKYPSMFDFMQKYQISFTPNQDIIFISLCFITTELSKEKIFYLANNKISNQKITKLKALAKVALSKISINYEQELAKQYTKPIEQTILTQIECKPFSSDFCSMTPLFPSFKVIFEKIKKQKQSFLQKNIQFCACGGVLTEKYNFYHYEENKFKRIPLNQLSKSKVLMIIEGYQFNGTFTHLKELLKLPIHKNFVLSEFRKPCTCSIHTQDVHSTTNIEEVILAGFVQHPQFITNADIDWKGLGLENSDLKKEFDHLKTIPGCSIDDMSTFCIRHVYPSTIADVLKEQEALEAKLKAAKSK